RNPQRRTHAAKLRQRHRAGRLLLGIRLAYIDVLPIRIDRQRHTARLDPPAHHIDRRPDRLLLAEPRERPASPIVDEIHHPTARAAILVPRMEAAVELHQLAEVRLALAPLPMRRAFPRPTP